MLAQLELRGGPRGITLQVLIESARGLENIAAIAGASTRCQALIFGAGDYIADTGIAATRRALSHPRARIAAAAAAAGLQAIDHVHPNVADTQALAAEAAEAREIGYAGKWAIHPQQVPVINAAFSPGEQEVARARKVIEACEQAQAAGVGALMLDGALVDEATLKIAQRCRLAAQRAGTWEAGEA
jgi:citrate lyase subunit beta/citryl-CoA lyase